MIDIAAIERGYYAAADPDDPAVITCWRRYDAKGQRKMKPWQRGVRYGPIASVKRADLPSEPGRRQEKLDQIIAEQNAWGQRVLEAIAADLDEARRLFASFTTRCSNCARLLTDAESKLHSLGPECRKQLS